MKFPAFRPDIADGAMLAVVLIWAVNNASMKVAIGVIPPLAFVFARFAIVIAIVWIWIRWRHIPARIARRDLPQMLLVGFCGFGAYNALIVVGMERTSAFSAALLISLGPVFTMILARLVGIERPSPAQWLATAWAMLGVLVFVGEKLHAEGFSQAASGDLIIIAAAPMFAVYSLAVRPLTVRYGATATTGWAVTLGLAMIVPWSLPVAADVAWTTLSPPIWGAVVYAGAGSTLAGYVLMSWAITRSGVTRTAPYLLLIPVGTGLISALWLGETFGPLKIVGAVMVLTGIALVRLLGLRPAPADRPIAPAEPAFVTNTPASGQIVAGDSPVR